MVSKSLPVGVVCFYSVKLLEAKIVMCFYIFCETNENEVTTVEPRVLTVGVALQSLKAAGLSMQVKNHKHFMAQDELLGSKHKF